MSWWQFKPYVSVAERRQQALREVSKLEKKGRKLAPVRLEGKTIASTFWGKAWCKHLESYSDYSNRLPRGRTYVRNGSVLDVQIEPGRIEALVSGSSVYTIEIEIKSLPSKTWDSIKKRLAGEIRSVIEMLQGRMSDGVMAVITDRTEGMFPAPQEISMNCSCPDSAGLCKHLAAVLYGVGARLDSQPELLFTLRKVNHLDLVPTAGSVDALTRSGDSDRKTINTTDIADVFGVEMDVADQAAAPARAIAKPGKLKTGISSHGKRAIAKPTHRATGVKKVLARKKRANVNAKASGAAIGTNSAKKSAKSSRADTGRKAKKSRGRNPA